MFWFILIIVFIFFYLLVQKDNQKTSKYLAATLLAYLFLICSMILYLSKDNYYYNVVNNYFSLPKEVWRYLMFSKIPKNIIIRMLNLSSLAVVYFGHRYSHSHNKTGRASVRISKERWLIIILGVQLAIYDPYLQKKVYYLLYPEFFSIENYKILMRAIHGLTVTFNVGITLLGMIQLIIVYKKVYYLRFLHSYLIGEGICYILIMLSYILIYWFSPTFLLKVSKIANYSTYLSVPLSDNRNLYTVYPYYLLVTSLLCAFCIYEIIVIKRKMKQKSFTITKQIDAADTTSKTFCHYMKNELLAIQSEIELLTVTEENEEEIQDVICRCENLYERLDIMHRSTKHSQLSLVETDISLFVKTMLGQLKSEFREAVLTTKIEDAVPKVMIDPNYFEQALINVIENALDSMEALPREERRVEIRIEAVSGWVVLSVQDSGAGISKKNMKHIFTPLYSSKPIKKHWGIGLSLTHRIVMAHDGKVEVESKEMVGTTFRILLPDLNQYVS